MSGWGDHNDEMPGPAAFDDATVEAFLSCRPVGAGEMGPLAAFAEDVRVAVDGPAPAPTAEMARLLAEGIPTPTGVTRAALAPRAGARHAAVSNRRKTMTISELLAALMAKLAGLGAASKAALGLGVAAASVTGAGAAGVLPDAAQHAVAEVVGAATPFELEDPQDAAADAGDDAGDLADDAADGATDGDGVTGEPRNHGACVSEVAHNAPRGPGGQHGRAVSAVARSDCGKTTTTVSPTTTTTVASSTTTTTVDADETTVNANRGRGGPGRGGGNPNHGNSGPGNSGNGNSGPGNSGNGNSGNGNSGNGNSGNGGGQGHGRAGR